MKARTNKLHESAENFLDYLHMKNSSEGTVKGYRSNLNIFFDFIKTYKKVRIIDNEIIENIKLTDLHAFLNYAEKELANSPATRARKVACLQSYYNYIYKKAKIVSENVAEELDRIKIPEKEVIYLNKEQSKKLLESVTKANRNYIRDLCVLTIFLNTGLRLSELQGLRIDMIKGDQLIIIGKGMKKREVFLNDECLNSINNYLENRDEYDVSDEDKKYLFLSIKKRRMAKNSIETMVKKYLKMSGFGEEYHTHTLRASFCTNVYNSGKVGIKTVRDLMGHSSISTTQKYLGVTDEDKRNAVKNIY